MYVARRLISVKARVGAFQKGGRISVHRNSIFCCEMSAGLLACILLI